MATWVEPKYKKGQVDKAAKKLALNNFSSDERTEILHIINNWRSTHSYPLHITKKRLQKRAQRVDVNSISAQRLKRLSSIALKLRRNRNMQLTQMQDIGGCRAVLTSIKEVRELSHVYDEAARKNPSKSLFGQEPALTRSEMIEKYDYIENPKPDGYRGYHFVFKYGTTSEKQKIYNGLRIEVQIRSRLQHAWATAVETVSTFTKHALKSGIGDERYKRFFALMGSAIAIREDSALVPNTPTNEKDLRHELKALCDELQIEVMLESMSAAVQIFSEMTHAQVYLLVLNSNEQSLKVTGFTVNELDSASQQYMEVEEQYANTPEVQTVLVSVDSVSNLQSAYPNYYLDTRDFLDAVRLATESIK